MFVCYCCCIVIVFLLIYKLQGFIHTSTSVTRHCQQYQTETLYPAINVRNNCNYLVFLSETTTVCGSLAIWKYEEFSSGEWSCWFEKPCVISSLVRDTYFTSTRESPNDDYVRSIALLCCHAAIKITSASRGDVGCQQHRCPIIWMWCDYVPGNSNRQDRFTLRFCDDVTGNTVK